MLFPSVIKNVFGSYFGQADFQSCILQADKIAACVASEKLQIHNAETHTSWVMNNVLFLST